MNRAGVPPDMSLMAICSHHSISREMWSEIEATINSAYRRYTEEFAMNPIQGSRGNRMQTKLDYE